MGDGEQEEEVNHLVWSALTWERQIERFSFTWWRTLSVSERSWWREGAKCVWEAPDCAVDRSTDRRGRLHLSAPTAYRWDALRPTIE